MQSNCLADKIRSGAFICYHGRLHLVSFYNALLSPSQKLSCYVRDELFVFVFVLNQTRQTVRKAATLHTSTTGRLNFNALS